MNNSVLDSEGTVVPAYALFALGLGVAVGAVWCRAVPAIGLAALAFGAWWTARS